MKKLFVITICIIFCANVLHSQTPYWKLAPRKMPLPVSGGQAVYDITSGGTKVYILGGYSDSLQQTVDWIQEYDAEADTWRMVGRMLQPRKQFVAGIWNGNVVYFGGALETSSAKTTLEIWNISSKLSPSIYDVIADFGRSFATGYVAGDNLYMFGGSPSAGGKISYIASYNLAAKKITWSFDFVSEEKPREQMTFLVNNNIYVFGGAFNGIIDKIQRFDIPPQKGEFLNYKLLEKRAGGSAVYSTVHRKGFLIAGYNESNKALRTVEEIIVYWDGSLKITQMPSLRYARYNPMAVDYKGIIAVFGGKDSVGNVVPYVETLLSVQTDVKEVTTPYEFKLEQNYPNPFNPSTIISYTVPKQSRVQIKIYDVIGNEVRSLIDEDKNAGKYNILWDSRNNTGSRVTSGVYLYKIFADGFTETKKMMLVK
ncbi:MAG: hypothetical protein FD143_1751 [Ignavibacteria bacterium]|nr:MAG: hypothetical protein FD143_1751 [Ignavibacteria bacterium]KAF0160099.1 MAG: hypothetical protein FD188_1913 [Ignavibacteria bacterium]